MTPLLPTPNDYLYNLIAMTSQKLSVCGGALLRHFDHTFSIAENL